MEEELFKAINTNNLKKVRELIRGGVDINKKNKYGETALIRSIFSDNLDILNAIIEAGANVNLQREDGNSSLTIAAKNDIIDIVNALIKAGANVNLQNKYGNTAIMSSVTSPRMINGHSIKVVNALIKAGADINKQNNNGNTALMLSLYEIFSHLKKLEDEENEYEEDNTEYKKEAIIHFENLFKFLIENNANPYLKNNEGETIFDIAKENGNQEIINMIVRVNNEKIKAQKKAFYNSIILNERVPSVPLTGLWTGINFNPYIARSIADYAFGEEEDENEGAEESKRSDRGDAGGKRRRKLNRKKSRSKRKSRGRKKSSTKKRKSVRKNKKSRSKKRKSVSRKYCLTTSPRKMGFSQKASCKAQGLLKRTSKKNKGKYVVSPKYKKRSRK